MSKWRNTFCELHTKKCACVVLCMLIIFTHFMIASSNDILTNSTEPMFIDRTRAQKMNREEHQDEIDCNRFHYKTTCLANTECHWCCNAPFGSQCFRAHDNHTNNTLRSALPVVKDSMIKCDDAATLRESNETCAMACARAGRMCESCELLSWCYYCRANHMCQSPEMSCAGSSIVQECNVEYDDSDSMEFAKRLFLVSFLLIVAALLILTITRVVKYVTESSDDNNTSTNNNNTTTTTTTNVGINNNTNNNITTTAVSTEQAVPRQVHITAPERQPLLSRVDEEESVTMTATENITTTNNNTDGEVHLTLANVSNNNNNIVDTSDRAMEVNRLEPHLAQTNSNIKHSNNANEQTSQMSANMSHLPHVSSSTIDEDHMCYLCLAARSTVTFLPCHHMCCCESCSNRLRPNEQILHCPFCRQKIDAMVSLPNIFM